MNRATMLLTLLGASLALAYSPVLSQAQVTQATQQGAAMVRPDGGYQWGPYLLLSSNTNGIRLAKNDTEVDGIALGTPFERLRYESYLSTYEQKPLTSTQAGAFARTQDHKLTFLIYTHSLKSVDEEEEEFQQAYNPKAGTEKPAREASYLDKYQRATLQIGGRTLSASPQVDGPYRDEFNLANGDFDFRFLGVIAYTFTIPRAVNAQQATMRFKDTTGRAYKQTVDLTKLR